MVKKLSIAFVWHFHQPSYQESFDKDFLMPWVRLHATKDYLDMLYYTENFSGLKLNFNFSPVLIDSVEKYANGAHDIHSRLLVSKIEELSAQEKLFILDNFFDANYNNMILPRSGYTTLYNKRYSKEDITPEDFSNQEYSDIMANFTLAWINKNFVTHYSDLEYLFKKEVNYSLEDRQRLFEISIDIMKKLVPTYKAAQDSGKIEISTSPYYHPILPLLLNMHERPFIYSQNLPLNPQVMESDALSQIKRALDRFEKLFDKRPNGVWLPEHCISNKTIDLLNKLGVQWTISDEGIVASSLNKEFQRDFEGNLHDPFHLANTYKLKGRSKTSIVFADSFFMNLISFGYGSNDPVLAANDLYEKIKKGQNKLANSPNGEHLLTIAMDGENCWESYPDNGYEFLNEIYRLIEEDENLETVLLSDYSSRTKNVVKLDNIAAGSWINRNFDLWIGEPVKNIAWSYLNKIVEDLKEFSRKIKDKELLERAYEEIYTAQGSDWFWWYGEPNESGRDHIFDHLFRERLKNVYKILNKPYPHYLDIPLISMIGKPIRHPKKNITPIIDGVKDPDINNWQDAGYILLPDSPTFSSRKVIKGIHYGCDEDKLYFRFDLNKLNVTEQKEISAHQIFMYFRNEHSELVSPITLANKKNNIFPIIKNKFSHLVKFSFSKDVIYPIRLGQAINDGLWVIRQHEILYAYKDDIEIGIPFEYLNVQKGEKLEFCIIEGRDNIAEAVYPQDIMLDIYR